jgi:predicted DNA-binding protein YlxM (UPF0122 family)
MATISKQDQWITPTVKVSRVIKYSSKTGKFYCELPEIIVQGLLLEEKDATVYGKNEGEAAAAFQTRVSEYLNARKEEREVILFIPTFFGRIPKPGIEHPNHYSDSDFIGTERGFSTDHKDIGLKIVWCHCKETYYRDRYSYSHIAGMKMNLNSWIKEGIKKGDIKCMDYTPERLEFFKGLQASFTELILKVYQMVGEPDGEKIAKQIESKAMKLLG